jgi:hypothetical protein
MRTKCFEFEAYAMDCFSVNTLVPFSPSYPPLEKPVQRLNFASLLTLFYIRQTGTHLFPPACPPPRIGTIRPDDDAVLHALRL